MVTSDFRPEVEIQPLRACAMKNMQYNLYLWLTCRNFRALKEICVEEHDSDVRYARAKVEIMPFRACAMHLAIIETVRSLWAMRGR